MELYGSMHFTVFISHIAYSELLYAVICYSEQLKEVTSTVDKKWNAVLAAYKQHRNAFTADSLCTATALRPSVTEQMATLEHLNRQWQVKYP